MQKDLRKCHPLLVITELFLPTKGGTAVWFDQVYPRLGGSEVHIVTRDVPGARDHDARHINSIHRLSLERNRWLRPESLLVYLKLFFCSLWVAIKWRIQAVHCGRVLPEGLVGLVIARILRKPLVVYAHGEEITAWKAPRRVKAVNFVYRNADMVIANSQFTAKQLQLRGVSAERIQIVNPGVNLGTFKPDLEHSDLLARITHTPDDFLLLSVGRLSRRKGFDKTIQATKALVDEGFKVKYAIAGIGEDHAYLQQMVDDLSLSQHVHLLGAVPADELPRWYNACDLFVMPNREVNGDIEGFGMVFLEAAACGKTSIGGFSGGAPCAIVDEVTGHLVDGDDVNAIKQKIQTLILDDDTRKRLSVAAVTRSRNEFGWEHVAAKTVSALNLLEAGTK